MKNYKNQNIINSFPRKRTVLNQKYRDIYISHYLSNRKGNTSASSMAQKMESWMHKKVATDLTKNSTEINTLEIGAGTLNQLKFEPITTYDIIEPFKELYTNSKELQRVNNIYSDITEIENAEYDRITSIATFEHITNLTYVVAKSASLLKENGTLRVAIPNEGTILWKLGWMFTTGLEFRLKYNLKYSTMLYHEHVNKADEIEAVLNYFYSNIKCNIFGINKKLGFYRFYECMKPKYDVVHKFLENKSLK